MRKLSYFILCMIFSAFSFAQNATDKKFRFGLGPGYSLPVSDLKEVYKGAIGINFIGMYNITNEVSIFAEAGAQLFKNKSGQNHELNFPLIAGARFTYSGFFAGAGLGHSIWVDNLDGFTYDVQIGYSLNSFNIVSHYTSSKAFSSSLAYFGFKLYYTF